MIRDIKRWFVVIALILGVAIVPLVVQARRIQVSLVEYVTWRGLDSYIDFFARGKLEVLILAGIIASILVLLNLRQHTDPSLKLYYILIGLFVLGIAISTFGEQYLNYIPQNFSAMTYKLDLISGGQYENMSIWGYPERYEGMIAWMCYLILFILAMKSVKKDDYQLIFMGLTMSSFLISLIGLTQLFGVDIFRTGFGHFLMNLSNFNKIDLSGIQYAFDHQEVYSTLFNPNYVGSYIALVLPVIVSLILAVKKLWQKILLLLLCILLLVILVGAGSLTGILGLGFAFLLLCLIHYKKIMKYVKWWGPASLVFILGLSLFIALSSNPTAVQIRWNLDGVISGIKGENNLLQGDYEQVTGLSGTEQVIYLETNIRSMYIVQQEPGAYMLYDDQAQQLDYSYNESGYYVINDGRYDDITVRFFYDDMGQIIMVVDIDGGEMLFQYIDDIPYVLGQNSNLYPLNYSVPSIGFENNQTFATNRGYIWSKSLPLIKEHLLIGAGPDSFAVVFPQYDVIGKRNMYKSSSFIVDKAHNMYLQIGIQYGLIALFIFLLMMVLYFIRFFKSIKYLKKHSPSLYLVNIGLTTGIFGFLVAGIGNDSTIGTSVVFWILLGLGVSLQILGDEKSSALNIDQDLDNEKV